MFLITVSPGRCYFLSLQLRTLRFRYVAPFAPQGHIGFLPQTQNCLIPKSGGAPNHHSALPFSSHACEFGEQERPFISLKSSGSDLLLMVRNFSPGATQSRAGVWGLLDSEPMCGHQAATPGLPSSGLPQSSRPWRGHGILFHDGVSLGSRCWARVGEGGPLSH